MEMKGGGYKKKKIRFVGVLQCIGVFMLEGRLWPNNFGIGGEEVGSKDGGLMVDPLAGERKGEGCWEAEGDK